MCTSIVEIVAAEGKAKARDGWFAVTRSVVSWDHPQAALLGDAVCIDFVNPEKGVEARAAVELSLDSARALRDALERTIAAAEEEELERPGQVPIRLVAG